MKFTHTKVRRAKKKNVQKITYKYKFDTLELTDVYQKDYNVLSFSVHGSVGKTYYRHEFGDDNQPTRIIYGNECNEKHLTEIINSLNLLLYCYLVQYPILFPRTNIQSEVKIASSYLAAKKWLRGAIESHKQAHPESVLWYNSYSYLSGDVRSGNCEE